MTLLLTHEQTTLLRLGRIARFISWHQARDGRWYPEILEGQYDGRTDQGWTVLVDGDIRHLPERIWAVYRS